MKRFIMSPIAWLGVIGSVVCNGWFSYGRGVIPYGEYMIDGLVFIAIFCSLDLLKPILPGLIDRTRRSGEYVKAVAATLLFICAISYSALAAYGFLQTNLANRVDGNAKLAQAYTASRNMAVEQAHIVRAAKQSHRWKSTNGCTNATVPKSKNFCSDYRIAANRLARAEQSMVTNKPRASADPQSAGLAEVTGLNEAFIGAAISIALALIVELFAAFGPFILSDRPRVLVEDESAPEEGPGTPRELPSNVTDLEAFVMKKIDRGQGRAMVSNAELVDKFNISPATATRAKKKMAKDGLVRIEKEGRSHRLVRIA